MRAIVIFSHKAFASRAKSFNSVLLALLHLLVCVCLHTGDSFSSVDFIGIDRMSIQISDHLHRVDLALDLHLVRFHCFLDLSANLSKPGIDARLPQSRIRCVLHGLEQFVVGGIEGNGESAVDDPALDVCPEVDLADVVIAEHCIVSGIGSVMRGNVVQRAPRRKCDSRLKAFFWCQFSVVVLQLLANVDQSATGLDDSLGKAPHLTLHLRCLSQTLKRLLHDGLLGFKLFRLDAGDLILMDLVWPVALELVVGEFDLDGCVPSSQASENLIGLRGWVVVFGLHFHLSDWLSLLGLFCGIGSFLFLLALLLLLFLLLALVFGGLLALLVGRLSFLLFLLLGLLGSQLHLAILLRDLHS